jgi:hypothetical protein
MPTYTTLGELRTYGDADRRQRVLKEAQNRSPTASTFLSHSSKDEEYVAGAIVILSAHGAAVYIDKKDETIPPYTNRETARILRDRIRECRKFVMLATTQSKDSKWMPWELGLADGFKSPANTAIFPGVDSTRDTRWAEREYLGIYDRIVWGQLEGYEKPLWMVWDHSANKAVTLTHWLAH